jgi:hypothetical protein
MSLDPSYIHFFTVVINTVVLQAKNVCHSHPILSSSNILQARIEATHVCIGPIHAFKYYTRVELTDGTHEATLSYYVI